MTREGKSENIWVEKQINYFFRLYLKGVGNPSHSAVTYEKRIKKKKKEASIRVDGHANALDFRNY